MISDDFDFFVTTPGAISAVQVYPENDTFTIEPSRERGGVVYQRLCSTVWRFVGPDFTLLYAVEQSADRCEYVGFEIKLKSGMSYWQGVFSLNAGKWFPDQSYVTISAKPDDSYLCITDGWDKEVNVLDLGLTPKTVRSLVGDIEEYTVSLNGGEDPEVFNTDITYLLPVPVASWALKTRLLKEHPPDEFSGFQYEKIETYAREILTSGCSGGVPVQPPGSGWIFVSGDCPGTGESEWVRKPATYFLINYLGVIYYTFPGSGIIEYTQDEYYYSIVGYNDAVIDEYDNGLSYMDLIGYFAGNCGLTVKSDFFGINPVGGAPANTPYEKAAANLQDLILFQKTDVKRAAADENATIAKITFKRLLEVLWECFQVRWDISGAELILEHISFFDQTDGLDLLALHPKRLAAKNAYTYLDGEIPAEERWKWMDDTGDQDFDGLPVVYSGACAGADAEEIPVREITTNIEVVAGSGNNISESGFCLVAAVDVSGTLSVISEVGAISGVSRFNGPLSRANLLAAYFLHKRPLISGNLNGADVTFDSARRIKKQEPFEIPILPADELTFGYSDLHRSGIGYGEIEKAVYDAKKRVMRIELLH